MFFRSMCIVLVGFLVGCGGSKPDGSNSRFPETSGPPKYPSANTQAATAKKHTVQATAIRKKHQTMSNGKIADVEEIALQLDIIGEQAGAALNFYGLVIDEIVVDGKPASRLDKFGMSPFNDGEVEINKIKRGPNRDEDQSPDGQFAANFRFKATPGAKKIDRMSGSVKFELPGSDWVRITNLEQGPIEHPKLVAMNIPAAIYRPHPTIVGVEFPEEPPFIRARYVDKDGHDIPGGTGSSSGKDGYLLTFSPGEEPPEGAALELAFSPLPVVEVPFVVENLDIKSQGQVKAELAKKEKAAAANFKTVASGVVNLGGDKFVIKDVFAVRKRIFPDDYDIFLFDFPLTEKDRDYLAKKGGFVAPTVGNKKRSPTPEKWDYAVIELGIDFDSDQRRRTLAEVEDGAFRFLPRKVYPGTMEKEEMLKHFQVINLKDGVLTVKSKSAIKKDDVDYSWDFEIQCMPITER